ncbi:dimethylarginine dimethylaminohydrolase family protein [uncultured Brevibacillus sp.]|uniref:dimethylarginine dimethylaminohydrolase family protein n=1 Tax=uncultured Brevibacillus sp. TaxID=169970 RepID=UPI0025966B60|nr:arginine deiminase family protein [uncultured Brevibacillus sp.]
MFSGSQSMVKKMKTVIIKHPNQAFISQEHLDQSWKTFNYTDNVDWNQAQEEYAKFEAILREHVENVLHLPQSDQTGLDSIYAHDPVKFTAKGAIILKSGKQLRQGEAEAYKAFLQENNIPILGQLTGDALADGGDFVWLDEKTLAIGLGFRTNQAAIAQITDMVKDFTEEVIVVPLPYDRGAEECLHLMSVISMVDHDLAVVYSKLMPVFFRQLLIDRGIQLIEVSDHEYENLGSNVLALAPRVCMVVAGNPATKQLLVDAGATVYEYEGQEISYKGTGGPTCLTCPVERV